MEILIAIIAIIILFFLFQTKKTVDINKLCFSPFPSWMRKYIQSSQNSVDKATLAKSLILQIIIISEELKAFKVEDHQEIRELRKLGPEESIQFVDGWIEQHLPTLEESVNKSIIETSSARYVFMLMLIAATSVNPRGSLREFLNRQRQYAPAEESPNKPHYQVVNGKWTEKSRGEASQPEFIQKQEMFGLFKSKSTVEHEKRVQFFYQNCKKEIQDYIDNCPEPSREDILKIAVNAKLTYALFVNVKYIQAEAREFIYPLTTNGLAVFISIDKMEEYAALEKMQALVKRNFDQLVEKNTSELSLPAIDAAFIMSELIGFDRKL